jgi:hypothetical protein
MLWYLGRRPLKVSCHIARRPEAPHINPSRILVRQQEVEAIKVYSSQKFGAFEKNDPQAAKR